MRRKVIRVLALTLIEFSARAAGFPTTTVFLVPGLANSTIAPYFSVDGQRILSESGLRVVELISLTSLGGFEANGKRVRDILDKECNKRNWIVAHSAGGFFSMAAIKESRCRITGLMTVGSPLAGSIIARDVFKTPIASLYRWARAYLWFESQLFDDLLPDEVEKFYKHVEPFPYCFRLLTVAGVQPQPSGWADRWNAQKISMVFLASSRFFSEDQDGMVTRVDALSATRKWSCGAREKISPEPQPVQELDHQELLVDQKWWQWSLSGRAEVKQKQDDFFRHIAAVIQR